MSFSMFALFVAILVGLIAFFHYLEGFFSATISAILAVLAAVLAVSYHEPIVHKFLGGNMADSAHAMVLIVLFAAIYLIGRMAFDKFVPGNLRLPALADKIGGAAMGLVAGVCGAGIVALAAQQMPFMPALMGHALYPAETDESMTVPLEKKKVTRPVYDVLAYDSFAEAEQAPDRQAMLIPADNIVLGLVSKLSTGALSGSQPLERIHPDWQMEMMGQRMGIQPAGRHVLFNNDNRTEVIFKENDSHPYAGLYSIPEGYLEARDSDMQMSFRKGRPTSNKDNETPKFPKGAVPGKPDLTKMLLVARIYFAREAADKNGIVRTSPGAVRLVTKREGQWANYFPVGTLEWRGSQKTMLWNRIDDPIFVNTGGENSGPRAVDFVFQVQRAGFLVGGQNAELRPAAKVTEGTFIEVNRMARYDLSGAEVKATIPEPRKDTVQVVRKPQVVKDLPDPSLLPELRRRLVGSWEADHPTGFKLNMKFDVNGSFNVSGTRGVDNFRASGTWGSPSASKDVLNINISVPTGLPQDLDTIKTYNKVVFDAGGNLTIDNGSAPMGMVRRQGPEVVTPTPTPPDPSPPTPKPTPVTNAVVANVNAEVTNRFFTPIALPAPTTDGQVQLQAAQGALSLQGGKVVAVGLGPVDVTTVTGNGENAITELLAPAGYAMVQIRAEPLASGDPWAWVARAHEMKLVDAKGASHAIRGMWVAFEEGGPQKLFARYGYAMTPQLLQGFKPANARPNSIHFAFLVPSGTEIKSLNAGNDVQAANLNVQAP